MNKQERKNQVFSQISKVVISILLIICGSVPFLIGGGGEHYNTWSGEIVCTDNCWHEIGHKIDHQSGWISQSEEYKAAVDGIVDKDKSLALVYLFNRNFGLYAELYAEMLNMVDGDINKLPVGLQQFYNAELANAIMEEL